MDHRIVRFLFSLNANRFRQIVEQVGNNRNPLFKNYFIKSVDVGFSYSRYENINASFFSINNIDDLDQLFRLLISFYRVTYTDYTPQDLEILAEFITDDRFYSKSMSIIDFNNKYVDQMPSNIHLIFNLSYYPSVQQTNRATELYNFEDLYETDLVYDPLADQDDIYNFYLDRLNRRQEEEEDYIEEQEFMNNLDNLLSYQEQGQNSRLAKQGSGLISHYIDFKENVAKSSSNQ